MLEQSCNSLAVLGCCGSAHTPGLRTVRVTIRTAQGELVGVAFSAGHHKPPLTRSILN